MIYEHLPASMRRLAMSVLVGVILFTCIVALAYTFFARATADDFCRASYPESLAWLAHIKQEYMEWSGRWAAHSVYVLTFPKIGITSISYPLLILLSGPIWFLVFFIATHLLFGNAMRSDHKAFLALLFLTIFWASMPGPGDTWYWLTGSTEYQLPFLIMCLCLFVLTASLHTNNMKKTISWLVASVLAIIVSGFNELVGLILLGVLFFGMILALGFRRLDATIGFAAVLTATLFGVAVNLLAPGTAVHAAESSNSYNLLTAIRLVFTTPGQAPLQWLGQPTMLWVTVLLVTSPWFLKNLPAWVRKPSPLPWPMSHWLVLIPLIGLVAVHCTLFAADYAQGFNAPTRILDITYAVFLIGWLASLIPLGLLAADNSLPYQPVGRALHLIAAVMLPLSILIAPNVMAGVSNSAMTARVFAPAVAEREAQMRAGAAIGTKLINLRPINASPALFSWSDLSQDPNDWRNKCFARYYQVGAVRVSKP